MKKHKKIPVANKQEDEDADVYTLYPENASIHTNKKQQQKEEEVLVTALKANEQHNDLHNIV